MRLDSAAARFVPPRSRTDETHTVKGRSVITQRYLMHPTNGITFKQTSYDGGKTWRDDPYVSRTGEHIYGPPEVFYHVYAYDGKRCVLNGGSRNISVAIGLATQHTNRGYVVKRAIRHTWPVGARGSRNETYQEVTLYA